jgi:hypothetical protein
MKSISGAEINSLLNEYEQTKEEVKQPIGYLDDIYLELVKIRKLLEGVFRERE